MCILAYLQQSKKLMSLKLNKCISVSTALRGNEDFIMRKFC